MFCAPGRILSVYEVLELRTWRLMEYLSKYRFRALPTSQLQGISTPFFSLHDKRCLIVWPFS